ncbi:MAG: C10 family peptidase [bacterium]|nr:C10 family peptidase [bacterium]
MIEPITPELARAAGAAWLTRVAGARAEAIDPREVVVADTIVLDDDEPGIHIVTGGTGWALVAGDRQARPILGWARAGEFPPPVTTREGLPPGLIQMLADWGIEILQIHQAPGEGRAALDNPFRAMWDELLEPGGRAALDEVEELPALLAARWGQGAGWNAHCPVDPAGPAGRAYAGCVATAMAQVLFHHQHPWRGQGHPWYEHPVYGGIGLDMLAETPAWKDMRPVGATAAAARLLYLAGVGVRMNYGPRGSSAQSAMVATALRLYLRYRDTARMVWRSSTPPETWENLIEDEIRAGRPIVHRGQGPSGGHAFNLDGWRSDGYKHLNFGWSGTYNGWYTLDAITPGSKSFTAVQGMVVGIEPRGEELLHPLDGDGDVTPHAVTLRWLPREGMARVSVQLSLTAQFTQIVLQAQLPGTYTAYTASNLAPVTTHHWRLIWFDRTGRSFVTPASQFTTGQRSAIIGTGPGGIGGPRP